MLRDLLRDGQVVLPLVIKGGPLSKFEVAVMWGALAVLIFKTYQLYKLFPSLSLTLRVLLLLLVSAPIVLVVGAVLRRRRSGTYRINLTLGLITNESVKLHHVLSSGDKIGCIPLTGWYVLQLKAGNGEVHDLVSCSAHAPRGEVDSLKAIAFLISQKTPARLMFLPDD